jgi:hypothetical protein
MFNKEYGGSLHFLLIFCRNMTVFQWKIIDVCVCRRYSRELIPFGAVNLGTSCKTSAGIFKQSMGARNQVGIGLSYHPTILHSLAELVPRHRFLGSL